jgi:riboflavin kinase/FMN adenylyltransferase
MLIEEGLQALARIPPRATVSVGNFDGLHLGHRQILAIARQLRDQHGDGELIVVTFEPHPLTVLKPELAPPRITSPRLKHAILESVGVDRVILLPPSKDVLGTTAEDFFVLLRDRARVRHLVEGEDFNFGRGRGGNIDRLREWCARDGIGLTTVEGVTVRLTDRSTVPVSSSLIRWLIAHGRAEDAALCLGRPFTIEGIVEHGEQRGRTIGFPTANVAISHEPLLLAGGVYAARWNIDGIDRAVALSVGAKETFHDQHRVVVEAYVLDFSGDLYGRNALIEVIGWLREQTKYPSVESLIEQLHRDVARVREIAT